MANALANLAKTYTSSTGTGNIVLGNVVPGFVDFPASLDGQTVSYGIHVLSPNGTINASEVGSALYTSATRTLSSRTPVTSTNSNNAVSLPGMAGGYQTQVFITALATDIGGAGTVTSVSAGDLSPLFTTNVADPTTTPDITFSLSNASANTYFGNATGGATSPSFTAAGALTKVDDTNVTLTLSGAPTTALLTAASITAGWTGQLGLTRGGTNASLTASNGGILYSTASAVAILAGTATANQVLLSGSSTTPAWSTNTFPAMAAAGTVLHAATANTITASATPTLGIAGTTKGTLALAGNTSGTVTIQPAAAAGTWTLTLPTTGGTNNYFLQTNGSGVTTWAAAGGGSPGGSDTQLQYNNAGSFGGITGATTNGTVVTLTSALATTAFSPSSNDGAALGTTSLGWSDAFLASGGVINWNNGTYTLTQNSTLLTASGNFSVGTSNAITTGTIELGAATDTTISRDSAGVIAVEGVPLYSNVPQNSQSTAYTTVLADAQKHILHPTADNNARTFTIAANASVAYPIGTAITFVNQINTVTIAINSDTLVLAGPGTTGSRTLAANGIATALKIASTTWVISGTGLT